MLETSIYSTEDFTTCCNCGDFELEHLMRPGLRHLKDNNPLNADIKIPQGIPPPYGNRVHHGR